MQFSPKKTERYLAALRNYLHKRIWIDGINEKRLHFAKKLFICSVLYRSESPCPTDMALFCKVMLSCAQVELMGYNKNLEFMINGNSLSMLHRDLFTALILEIANCASKISVNIKKERIDVFYHGKAPQKRLKAITRTLKGTVMYETKNQTHAIFVPLYETAQKSKKITGAVELLTDPLSPVKIFIHCHIKDI